MAAKTHEGHWPGHHREENSFCFTVKTLGLVSIAQDGFVAAQACAKKNPRRAKRLNNLAETLLSAAMVVLRHEEAAVPQEVMAAISQLTDALRAPVVRKQRRA